MRQKIRSLPVRWLILCAQALWMISASAQSSVFQNHFDEAQAENLNYAYLLELGDDALLARVNLIRGARESIEIQTFIWAADETGGFMFVELFNAAERGVKVRLLIDDFSLRGNAAIVPYLAVLHENIEIKHYNPLADSIDINVLQTIGQFAVNFGKANHRMHNKVVVVDGRYGITGGRNYENDYFDRGSDRTFKDRDILVVGPIVNDMLASFEEYWADDQSVHSRDLKDVRKAIEQGDFVTPMGDYELPAMFKALDVCASDAACVTERIVSRGIKIDEMVFVADHPGKHEDGDDLAETTESMVTLMQRAKKRIVMQTPYLVVGSGSFFKDLIRDNEDLEFIVSTNSLGAADHFYAYAFSYKNKKKYLRKYKWQIHELKPDPMDFPDMVRQIDGVTRTDKHYACIHAKTYLFDDDVVWLGSFNLDPRSVRLNTEAGIILRDPEFFAQVYEKIDRAIDDRNAWTIGPRRKVPILTFFNSIFENIFSLIPIANVWPFTYSMSYELREGGEAVPFFDDRFHDNYRAVGQFPGTGLSGKAIKTRITKAFFGPVEPII